MAVLVPRIRTLGLRLSEPEYSALEKYSIATGARSISDVARTAICDFIRRASEDSLLASAANKQVAHVESLEQRVSRLTAEIVLLRAEKASSTVEREDQTSDSFGGRLEPGQ